MSLFSRIGLLGGALITLNYFSHDFIFNRLGGTIKNNATELWGMIRCGVGLALFPPTADISILGRPVTIVYPTISSIIYTVIVTLAILWLASLVWKKDNIPLSQIFLLIVIVWASLKAIGLAFILWSGSWCLGLMMASRDVLNPFYQAGLFITPFIVVKLIWEKFFGKG